MPGQRHAFIESKDAAACFRDLSPIGNRVREHAERRYGGADDGNEPRAKKKRTEWSKHNAELAAQRAMRYKGGE